MSTVTPQQHAWITERNLLMLILKGEADAGGADPASTLRGAVGSRAEWLTAQLAGVEPEDVATALRTDCDGRDTAYRASFRELAARLTMLVNSLKITP